MKVNIGNYRKSKGRKVNVEINGYDTWNLDSTLAYIIFPALVQLKETKHGVPGDFVNDVGGEDYNEQGSFDFYSETHKEAWDEASKKWDEVLDKMIWSFYQLIIDYDKKYHYGKHGVYDFTDTGKTMLNPITGKVEKTFAMVDRNPNGHWFDSVGLEEHNKRIQEGLELFGKYYRSLWD